MRVLHAGIPDDARGSLGGHPEATERSSASALSGNLCRCTGYQNIVTAALRAAGRPREEPAPSLGRKYPLGAAIPRREDLRLLTGTATFTDDLAVTGAVHAHFLRSPHAHARITALDADAARAADGVLGVFTGSDLAQWTLPARIAPPIDGLAPQVVETLPTAKVRFAGDPIAVVVATDRYRAEDAAALIRVEYEPLEPVLDAAESSPAGLPWSMTRWSPTWCSASSIRQGTSRQRSGGRTGWSVPGSRTSA